MKWTKEYRRKYMREWHKGNRERVMEYQTAWRKANMERCCQYTRKYRSHLPRKSQEELDKTNAYRGFNAEKLVMSLISNGKHLTEQNMLSPYDIEWNGRKIDVKSSSIHITDNWLHWGFKLRGKKTEIDFYLCVGYSNEGQRFFLVPFEKAPKYNLSIPVDGESKYYRYEITREVLKRL